MPKSSKKLYKRKRPTRNGGQGLWWGVLKVVKLWNITIRSCEIPHQETLHLTSNECLTKPCTKHIAVWLKVAPIGCVNSLRWLTRNPQEEPTGRARYKGTCTYAWNCYNFIQICLSQVWVLKMKGPNPQVPAPLLKCHIQAGWSRTQTKNLVFKFELQGCEFCVHFC